MRYRMMHIGRSGGKTVGDFETFKTVYPNGVIMVPDRQSLDTVVKMGIQPSNVMLTSELANVGHDAMITIGV